MDIVIPYKKESRNGLELKYALRSIVKYLSGYDEIFIVGDKPDWIQNIIHIKFNDDPSVKERNICNKILKACEDERVSDDFIMWHDDHFLLKPLNTKDFKRWYDTTLTEAHKKATKGYKKAIENTLSILISDTNYTPKRNYDIHTPVIFNKNLFHYLNPGDHWKVELVVKSFYCNVAFDLSLDEQMDDLKINDIGLTREIILKVIRDRLLFSIGERALESPMIEVLEELYPLKSKYENNR